VPAGRWAIHIDLEGFGELYPKEDQVLLSLGQLMQGICLIGSRCFPESSDRLFAHQLGDGFVIVSDFLEETLARPVGFALALLRHVSQTGRFAKATFAEGHFSTPARVTCRRSWLRGTKGAAWLLAVAL
jgi:hypothetical protein